MKILKPKERAKIYLEAAEYFSKVIGKDYWDLDNYCGFCEYLQWHEKNIYLEEFPEYFLFKPKEKTIDHLWFETVKNGKIIQNERILALLFAYQMALDAKE